MGNIIRQVLDGKFGRVHHGYLNDLSSLEALVTHCGACDLYTEVAEGDLCWVNDGVRPLLFFKHPSLTYRLPPAPAIREEVEAGRLHTLEQVLVDDLAPLRFIVELKTGHGPATPCLERALDLLERHAHGRYWVDTFDPDMLARVKAISPATPTSLHSRLGVYGRRVWRTSYEWPNLVPMALEALPMVDAVTVTYKNSPAHWLGRFGATIEGVHRHLLAAGKALIFGGVTDEQRFQKVRQSPALAAYRKFDKARFAEPSQLGGRGAERRIHQ